MFYLAKEFNFGLEDVMAALLQHIKSEGYVIIADINVKNILKNALNVDFKEYHILEICKPVAAKEIIGSEDLNGLFVPCKMIMFQDGPKTRIRLLSSSQIADSLLPTSSAVIRKFEKELFALLESFSM